MRSLITIFFCFLWTTMVVAELSCLDYVRLLFARPPDFKKFSNHAAWTSLWSQLGADGPGTVISSEQLAALTIINAKGWGQFNVDDEEKFKAEATRLLNQSVTFETLPITCATLIEDITENQPGVGAALADMLAVGNRDWNKFRLIFGSVAARVEKFDPKTAQVEAILTSAFKSCRGDGPMKSSVRKLLEEITVETFNAEEIMLLFHVIDFIVQSASESQLTYLEMPINDANLITIRDIPRSSLLKVAQLSTVKMARIPLLTAK